MAMKFLPGGIEKRADEINNRPWWD